jgi:hypothetical protein
MSAKFRTCQLRRPARTALAIGIATMFSLGAQRAIATPATWMVDSCDEASSGDVDLKKGTLRFAAANAETGSTIDMANLACSTISLTTGAITFGQDDIKISGPTDATLTISGKQNISSALITHNGSGTVTLQNLDLYYAKNAPASGYVHGGCVYSYASIVLDHVRATHCGAMSAGNALGGAVFAREDLSLKFSTIAFNEARGALSARAGGAYAKRHLLAEYSTIDSNTAYSSYAAFGGAGGGLFAAGILLRNSTVSNNHSHGDGGGIAVVRGGASGDYLKMYSSTLSGNSADHRVGGGYASTPAAAVYNSTIAFNTAAEGNRFFAAGLVLSTYFTPMTATLQNSLFSNNTVAVAIPANDYGINDYDLGAALGGTLEQPLLITFNSTPANNLIRSTFAAGVPSDTLRGSCPLLGPLRNNGGLTQTHALLNGSAAVDAGNNILGAPEDQRGLENDPGPPFPYARESNGVADIGAYELQQEDVIFSASGETCAPLPPPV